MQKAGPPLGARAFIDNYRPAERSQKGMAIPSGAEIAPKSIPQATRIWRSIVTVTASPPLLMIA